MPACDRRTDGRTKRHLVTVQSAPCIRIAPLTYWYRICSNLQSKNESDGKRLKKPSVIDGNLVKIRLTMADFIFDNNVVTNFLLDTCRLRQCTNDDSLQALCGCATLATIGVSSDDDETNIIPLITGSVAEFYIEPMLSCVGDHDVMYHNSKKLAIPAGTAPPTQLPDEFDNCVSVCEIVDSEFPGYVYLVWSYLLTECIDDGKYNAVECQRRYLIYEIGDRSHGPAFVTQLSDTTASPYVVRLAGSRHSQDLVYCTRCLSWPTAPHKPLIGQHDTETTAGRTQQPLIVLSAIDVMWFVWHIVSVDEMNGCVADSTDCHSHEQILYC